MEKFIISGGNKLKGSVKICGSKNVALKMIVAACLTNETVIVHNVPLIADFYVMIDILKVLGANVELNDHTVTIQMKEFTRHSIPLDKAALVRTSAMFIAPLLSRVKEAIIPNPGGCRLGARPIDWMIDGIKSMNTDITYHSEDGYFHAKTTGLKGTKYSFIKNTHTGTETMIIAAVLAEGTTILKNAAEEPEIDDLIKLLNKMGARIRRISEREIIIEGVKKLHGAEITISPDRNEIITFAIAAYVTRGDILVKDAQKTNIQSFLNKCKEANASFEITNDGIRFFNSTIYQAVNVTTGVHPGFMTDWQAPWAVLMTQADGESIIHETVFENKLSYIKDLKKIGANVKLFNPEVGEPEKIYNFNLKDDKPGYYHAVRIKGPSQLHNAVLTTIDIRAGAAMVIASLIAKGKSVIYSIEKLDRGYEKFDVRLASLGADIKRVKEGL